MRGYWGDSKIWNGLLTVMAGLNLATAIGFTIGGNSAMGIGCGAFSLACVALEKSNDLAGRVRNLERHEQDRHGVLSERMKRLREEFDTTDQSESIENGTVVEDEE